MEEYYQKLEMQLRSLRLKVKDNMDNPNHPMAKTIYNGLQSSEDAAQGNQNLRSIEDRLKQVQRQLQQSQNADSSDRFISSSDSEKFYEAIEDIRNDIRRQPHY